MGYRKRVSFVTLATAVLVAAALLVAGCGGSSSEAAPLKKPQFVAQANQICVAAQDERRAQGKEFEDQEPGSGDSGEGEEVMDQLLEPVEKMTDELSGLGAPKGEEKQVEAIIKAFEEAAAELEADPGGPETVSAFDEANKKAEAYGLTDCTI